MQTQISRERVHRSRELLTTAPYWQSNSVFPILRAHSIRLRVGFSLNRFRYTGAASIDKGRELMRATLRRRPIRILIVLIVLLSIGLEAQAGEIYKWMDENGKIHYGDRPTGESNRAREVKVSKTPAVDASVNRRNERTERLLEGYRQDREEKQEQRKALIAETVEREENCAIAKDSQFKYEHAASIYTKEENGERVVLTDEQHAKTLTEAQSETEKWCK
jgi:hypothetical protein